MAVRFTSANSDNIYISNPGITAPPFSMSCMMYHVTSNTEQQYIALQDKDSFVDYFAIYDTSSQYGFVARDSGGTSTVVFGTSVPNGVWRQIGGVAASTSGRTLYTEGVNRGSNTDNRNLINIDKLTLGSNGRQGVWGNWAFFNGRMCNVGIWNVALTDAEMTILGKGVMPWYVRPSALVYCLPFVRDIVEVKGATLVASGVSIEDHARVYY